MTQGRTRLAPSPTGALHLGNARTFLVNWALARQRDWHIVLRIEDLDGPRLKPGADQLAIDILQWLGLDWDEGPHYQKHHLGPYRTALGRLAEAGWTYPCHCTRAQVQSALSAPHADQVEIRYPGTCRPPESTGTTYAVDERARPAWRLRVPDEAIAFDDEFAGPRSVNVHEQVGDFVIATRHQLPAYQLAVVVDDDAQGIDQVVRADDLIDSTGRQLLLYRLLDLSPCPHYLHLPLVLGPDGRRLAKRHGDTRVASYREAGVNPERIIGLLAEWCGLGPRREISAHQFADRFDLGALPRQAVTCRDEDHRWLIERKS